ncbi:MAG: universal stress protein [Caldimonas sp.]
MSYKTLLVHLDAGPRCAARIALACDLAARFDSRLVAVAPTGLPDLILSINSAVPDSLECIALPAASLRERAQALARDFEQRCSAARVGSFESRVVVDEAIDAVVRHGRCSDLVIVGQRDPGAPVEGVASDFPQQVLLHAGTPVLIVPHSGSFASVGQRVLIAWQEKAEATRAIRDALPLLRIAERVVLCEIAESEADDGPAERFESVLLWLATHGVHAKAQHEPKTAGVGDKLLSLAADLGVDLIVAGGYGHSRLREWVLGGTTRHLLEHMTVPTLLSH